MRLRSLPNGDGVPLAASVWRLGDAVWVLVEAEHYSHLQTTLRQRFAERPVIVATLTNGWRPGYLPAKEAYAARRLSSLGRRRRPRFARPSHQRAGAHIESLVYRLSTSLARPSSSY